MGKGIIRHKNSEPICSAEELEAATEGLKKLAEYEHQFENVGEQSKKIISLVAEMKEKYPDQADGFEDLVTGINELVKVGEIASFLINTLNAAGGMMLTTKQLQANLAGKSGGKK